MTHVSEFAIYFAVLLIAVTFIWGLEYCFNDGEIFGKPGNWMRKHWPEWINKPLFQCKYCMSSVWGTTIFVAFLWGWSWPLWILFCFCCCGLTAIFDK